jgi:hypothetical protein
MRRILLITLGSLFGLGIVCIGLLYFVGLPRVRDGIADQFKDSLATVVAAQVTGQPVSAGTYLITDQQLTEGLQSEVDGGSGTSIKDISARITDQMVQIVFASDNDDVTMDLQVAAENGKLVVTDATINNGIFRFLLPEKKLADAVEEGVNNALAAQGLQLQSVALAMGEMTLVTQPAT